ncbi:MAG: hypothetical protein M3N16_04665 [Actinomycetota bacterium]|nr:hypothetical protein [Actinomycetota bacterium]
MSRRLASERGLALVTAVVMMSLMMSVGLTAFAYVDVQQRESGIERIRESAFNLAEGALSAQTFLVARKWPSSAVQSFPRYCSSTSSADPGRCPDAGFLAQSFATADFAEGSAWVVSVRDNGGDLPETAKVEKNSESYYDPADDDAAGGGAEEDDDGDDDDPDSDADDADDTATDAQPSWDRSGDGRVWIRSQAIVRTKRRTLVALVDVDELAESFPQNVITAGKLTTGGNPHLAIVTKGSPVGLRDLAASAYKDSQIDLPKSVSKRVDGGKALSDGALKRLRQLAIARGTYYASGCPASLAGDVVFIESSGSGLCTYTGNSVFNCPAYGVVVVASGGISLGGTVDYCGVIYLANTSDPPRQDTLLKIFGTASVTGAVAVDGPGGVQVGNSSKPHVTYDPDAVGAVRSYPSGSIVPSTWREIPG